MTKFLADMRYAWRTLLRSPVFSVTVLLTLAVGLGATVAIFTVVNAMLLRPLPYPQSDRMVMVWQNHTRLDGPAREWFTPPDFVDVREQTTSFAGIAAVGDWNPTLTDETGAETLPGAVVSSGWFDVVRVHPQLGSGFDVESERPGAPLAVVLSHGLWQRRFGGARDVIGRTIHLNDVAHEIVGVMPEGFRDPLFDAEIWRSRQIDAAGSCGRGCYTLRVIGRVRDDVNTAAAASDVARVAARIAVDFPRTNRDIAFDIVPLKQDLLASTKPTLIALSSAVALLLLIAIVNVANLLVARAGVREREVSIRTALGAPRGVIARELLAEALLLGVIGAAAGSILAVWAVAGLVALAPAGTPRIDEVSIDAMSLLFAFAVGTIAALAAALGPALQATRSDIGDTLNDRGGLRASVSRRRARSALIIAEIAIALTLLIGAGLTLKSLARLQNVDPGFDQQGLLTGRYLLPSSRYPEMDHLRSFIAAAIERVAAVPGVVDVATTSMLPMRPGGDNDLGFQIIGRPLSPDERAPTAWYRVVSPNYFDVMGIRLRAGRMFGSDDRPDGTLAVIVNEEFQRRHFAGESAVGKRLSLGGANPPLEIVGVTQNTKHRGLANAAVVELFLSSTQVGDRGVNLVVRTTSNPLELASGVHAAVRRLDPALPMPAFAQMEQLVADTIALPRLYSAFFAFFAIVALLLAAVGVYGLTAYTVGQRRQEIGIRVALGARTADVVRMVVQQSILLTLAGLAIGVIAAAALSQPLGRLLFELSPRDAAIFIAVPALLGVIALLASWVPARRAARIDPLVAIRPE